jgi:hypothetical protein
MAGTYFRHVAQFEAHAHLTTTTRDAGLKERANAMNTSTHQGTAKIYQFPTRLRSPVSDHRSGTSKDVGAVSQSVCDTALDACWYHDDAVKQSARSPKP